MIKNSGEVGVGVLALEGLELGVVAESSPLGAPVNEVALEHVALGLLLLSLATEVVLPGDVVHDGATLGELEISVNVVGELKRTKEKEVREGGGEREQGKKKKLTLGNSRPRLCLSEAQSP